MKHPLPATVSMTPWLSSSAYAFATVLRLTRSSSASGWMPGSGIAGSHGPAGGGRLHLIDELQIDALADLKFSWNSICQLS